GSKLNWYPQALSWCNSLGYQVPKVKDLTNAVRTGVYPISGATPSSPGNHYMRHIGSGFLAEWGRLYDYSSAFGSSWYWTSDPHGSDQFIVKTDDGTVHWSYSYPNNYILCSHP
ncbi:hypothetical protein, partial [Gilliamella sp. B3372]